MSSTISVCMATFNGAAYIDEQVDSILSELGPDDELVVVDDASTDETRDHLASLTDQRVRVHQNTRNQGYVGAFERALELARGDLIFLADQDDVWPKGRVEAMLTALHAGATVAAGNVAILGGPDHITGPLGEHDWRLDSRASSHTLRNLLRLAASDAPYFGSAMAVTREALELALPFPTAVRELHDAWLALLGMFSHTLVHVDERVVLRREHDANTTGRIRSPLLVLRGRLYFLGMCAAAWRRTHGRRRSH